MKTKFAALMSLISALVLTSCVGQYNASTGQFRVIPSNGGGYQQEGPSQMARDRGESRGYNGSLPQGHEMMPDGRVRYVKGYQQTQTGQNKTLRSHFEAKVDGDQSRRTDVARYAGEYYDRTGTLLTEQQLTAHFGFRCAARKVN